jgi:hypothetical protein
MIFKAAIAAAALGVTILPSSAILLDNLIGAGAAELQQVPRVCASHRCGWNPGYRVHIVERRYYPRWINATAYDAEFAREYWKGIAEPRSRAWY